MLALAVRDKPFLVWTEECVSGFRSRREAKAFARTEKSRLSGFIGLFHAEFSKDGSLDGLTCVARYEQNPKPPAE
jgi:hypothetical protein